MIVVHRQSPYPTVLWTVASGTFGNEYPHVTCKLPTSGGGQRSHAWANMGEMSVTLCLDMPAVIALREALNEYIGALIPVKPKGGWGASIAEWYKAEPSCDEVKE